MRIRRRNITWLLILGVLVGIAVLSEAVSPIVAAALVGFYLLAAAGTLLEFQPGQALARSRSSLVSMRMTPEAREAIERAERRGGYMPDGVTLLDVGLIAARSSADGVTMRRARGVSLDDDGARPFIKLHAQPSAADRTIVIRFEMIDTQGEQRYVHEISTFLRDGEMDILADHQLPLFDNVQGNSPGDWDLRIYIDRALIGAQRFVVAPSVEERRYRRLERDEQETSTAEDMPMSLEDLLRSQRRQSGQ